MTTLIDLPPEVRGGRLRRKYEARIIELNGICLALIAEELGLQERTIAMLQRKLGLRQCRPSGDRSG